jgi:hypothetical protein
MSLGRLVVSLAANTAEFTADMGKAAHEAAKNMERMQRQAAQAGKAIGAMFAAGVGTAAVLTKQAINAADSISKMAQSTGIEVKLLSELNFAARLSNVSTEALATSMGRLNRNIYDAAAGTGEALQGFRALGIQVRGADGNLKSADAVMAEVADKFKGMEDGAGKSALAMMLFGKSGAAMIPMLNGGAAALNDARMEAVAFGLQLDGETGQAAERFNDNLTRLNAVKAGMANQIMKAVLPSLNSLTDQLVDSAKNTNLMGRTAEFAANGIRILVTGVVGGAAAFQVLGDSVGKVAAALVAAARGEFRSAWEIISTDGNDMASVIETAMQNINAVWNETGASATRSAEAVIKASAPLMANAKELAAAERERAAAIKAAEAARKKALDEEIAQGERLNEMFQAEKERQAQLAKSAHDAAEQHVEQIRVSLLTEQELLAEAHETKLLQLMDARERDILTQEEYNEYQAKLAEEYQRRLGEIERQGWTERQQFEAMSLRKKAQTIFGELAGITAGVAQSNRKMFELNKVAGIANAILNAYEGISLTMAKYPFPINVAMAAAHGLAAFAQVQAIQSAQFGGGAGAAPSIAGSTPATPVSPVSSGAPGGDSNRTTIVKFSGTADERKLIKRYTDLLNENAVDGGRLIYE